MPYFKPYSFHNECSNPMRAACVRVVPSKSQFRSASKSKSDESAFRMAYVLAYMLVASHTMVFVLFIFNKSGLGRNTAQDEGESK